VMELATGAGRARGALRVPGPLRHGGAGAKGTPQGGKKGAALLSYGELLPGMAYLVRRLLENTANESFLRQSFVEGAEVDRLLANPSTDWPARERVHSPRLARETSRASSTSPRRTSPGPR